MDFQRQYNLRNRKVNVDMDKVHTRKISANQKKKDHIGKDTQKEDNLKKIPDPSPKEIEKSQNLFNLENEIAKIKMYVPFNEILNNAEYRGQINKMLRD